MTLIKSPLKWTVAGVLDEIENLNRSMPDRSLAFVLGSGASVTSGIPTGKTMAEKWLDELHRRECHDGSDCSQWIASDALEIDGLAWDRAAEFYPQIFERRFRGDPESGFASLESIMDGKEPSLGYSLLAEIMQHTRHKIVVTTNFDNLVADALAIHAYKPPLIVGHESLTGYVRPLSGRPLVAKIHRDLFLHPKNDEAGVSTLEQGWQEALTRLFKHYMPLVIGYGGNDGSLMGFLNNLKPGDINGRIFWCYRKDTSLSQAASDLLMKHNGVMVEISDFDEFMLQLAAKLIANFDIPSISKRIELRGKKRAESYREQAEKLQKNLASVTLPSEDQQATQRALTDALKDLKDWWSWQMRASAEADMEKRNNIYQQGIAAVPGSAELKGNYANFLYTIRKNYDAAEAMYKKALELDPNNAKVIGNYAAFLQTIRKDDAAEAMYKKALELDPNDANVVANYACLQLICNQLPKAREYAVRAIKLSGKVPTQTAAEALLYLALGNVLQGDRVDNELGRLKSLLHSGYERGSWSFDTLFTVMLPRLSPDDRILYEKLGAAILDEKALAELEQNALWQKIEERPWFED